MNEFLKGILDGINSLFNNYGWSIMVFTILIKLVLTPFDYKSRASMRKTTKLQPKIAELQKKYAKDQEKLNAKMAALYKAEGVNPLSSCLPMLLTFPVLIAMFNAMRAIANDQLVQQAFSILQGNEPVLESWLWIKNLWMPDSPFAAAWPDLNSLRMIPADIWQNAIAALDPAALTMISDKVMEATGVAVTFEAFMGNNLNPTIEAIHTAMSQMPAYVEHTAAIPGLNLNLIVTSLSVMRDYNGWFLLPILSAVSQYVMSAMQPSQPDNNANQQQKSTNNFMKWFFPIFTLWLCFSYTAGFALYWVTSNLYALVSNWAMNKYLDAKEAKLAAAPVEDQIK